MSGAPDIKHLSRNEIDARKWDTCITAAPNGLIYAYSWYLDALCTHWDALVLGDYEVVMPLPWRSKWGIKYVYTPAFIQQLGIIGTTTNQIQQAFISLVQQRFKYGSYFFNYANEGVGSPRTNFILDLSKDYQQIATAYATDLKNNVKKASRYHLKYGPLNNVDVAVDLFRQQYGSRLSGTAQKDFENFKQLCKNLKPEQDYVIRSVEKDENSLVAISLLLKAKERLYLLMATTTDLGRKVAANHFLLDQLIREFAGTNTILDFEGSDLPGVYSFYKTFGGQNQPYFSCRWNHLPPPIRWMKK